MKNQIIDSFIINPDALNSEEDKQKLETEVSNMCSDMALVQALAGAWSRSGGEGRRGQR